LFIGEGDADKVLLSLSHRIRHHVFIKTSHREVQLAEVGPRFEMKPYEIRQGTVEQSEADIEWQLRPFMNTARKRNQL
jgi:U3 small nucleolar ribonucleoprotein protein IMP4